MLVTLVGRYDWSYQSSFNRDYGNKSERDDKEFTWRGGVNYLFDNGVTPYFSYSESFEPALVTLGGRYDWADQSSFNRDYGNKSERDDKEFTWRGGVNYMFDNGVTPYFSYSETFEPASQTDANGDLFAPSKGKQYEVGVKYVPEDRPIVVTGALYQLTKLAHCISLPKLIT